MTKQVRIENADTNTSKKVLVETWDRNYETGLWKLTNTQTLDYPTQMLSSYITESRQLRIREE